MEEGTGGTRGSGKESGEERREEKRRVGTSEGWCHDSWGMEHSARSNQEEI
jgi:hypothetical protein